MTKEISSQAETAKQLQYGATMKTERMNARLEEIQTLLSHLHGEVTALEESYSDVLQVLRKLQGAVDTDDLTGLLRRRPFFNQWQVLLDACRSLNEECGVILIDIDHFKKVNDTHGHPTGDEVIKRISSMLKQYQNPRCIVSRYGGEEFAVAVHGSNEEVCALAERIREHAERIRIPLTGSSAQIDGGSCSSVKSSAELSCTISVGVASTRDAGFDAPRLLKSADLALYEAKHGGRNQVRSACEKNQRKADAA